MISPEWIPRDGFFARRTILASGGAEMSKSADAESGVRRRSTSGRLRSTALPGQQLHRLRLHQATPQLRRLRQLDSGGCAGKRSWETVLGYAGLTRKPKTGPEEFLPPAPRVCVEFMNSILPRTNWSKPSIGTIRPIWRNTGAPAYSWPTSTRSEPLTPYTSKI